MELANKAVQGAFDQKPVFKGLCYIMLQAAERKEQGKGLRNLKYSTEFLNFLIVLESISLKALNLFCCKRSNIKRKQIIYQMDKCELQVLNTNELILNQRKWIND
ncbi:hypothetical protein RirG_258940 [Rhizophagus irregularis DAOM 197198w]|nr:hypothetical protein RirG_258940 [Rhizophagus irregularis DAOM 197198w]